MKVGLFFGSFNPIHIGHLAVAQYVLNFKDLDKISFVVSPQNPLKRSSDLWPEDLRLELVKASVEGNDAFEANDVEFDLPRPSYSVDTIDHLRSSNPENEYSLIIGSDNLKQFDSWKNFDRLLSENKVLVYQRLGSIDVPFKDHRNIIWMDSPVLDISSTRIRKMLSDGLDIRYLVSHSIYQRLSSLEHHTL